MKDIKLTITINCPAHEVFNFTINPENTPKWVAGVIQEKTNETPVKLGTIYKNQGKDASWSEFEVTAFKEGSMFELTKKDDNHHVKYTFSPLGDEKCELEYYVWVEDGSISERFSEEAIRGILQKLKDVVEEQK